MRCPPHEPAERAHGRAHLPGAAARRGAADEVRGPADLGVPKELVGAAIFGLASLTDWLDGYLARRRQQITALGQISIRSPTSCSPPPRSSRSCSSTWRRPGWSRSSSAASSPSRGCAAWPRRGVAMPASPLGKLKMASQVIAILLLILRAASTCAFSADSAGSRCGAMLTAVVSARGLLPAVQRRAQRRLTRVKAGMPRIPPAALTGALDVDVARCGGGGGVVVVEPRRVPARRCGAWRGWCRRSRSGAAWRGLRRACRLAGCPRRQRGVDPAPFSAVDRLLPGKILASLELA